MSSASRMIRIRYPALLGLLTGLTFQLPSIFRCEWMLADPTRMNRCFPLLITPSTTCPVRSTVAYFGTRISHRVSVLPANASRRRMAVCQTVSPSGMVSLSHQFQREFPQPFGIGRVERIRRDATPPWPTAPVDHHGLVAVLEVAAADSVQQRGRRQQHRCRGSLLDRLEVAPARTERLQRLLRVVRGQMALQWGGDTAGHQRVDEDAFLSPPAGGQSGKAAA